MRHPKGDHSRVKSVPLDKRAGPLAKFVFRYRLAGACFPVSPPTWAHLNCVWNHVAILQAQGILPASAATGSRMGNKAKARAASPPIYAPRRSMTEADEDRKPVKHEPASGAGYRFDPGEVIELSSDEEDRVSPKP